MAIRPNVSREQRREAKGWEPDPAKRMNRCAWDLSLKLRRGAKAEEILTTYEAAGLATGHDDDGNRRKLAVEAAAWLATHFEPGKGERFDPQRLLSIVRLDVTPAVRRAVSRRNRSRYGDEQLAIVLYVVERASLTRHPNPALQFTCPNDSFIGMFRALGAALGGSPDGQRRKLAAMKAALVLADLASVVDGNWNTGRGKRYGLGPKHPSYDRFLQFTREVGQTLPSAREADAQRRL